MSCHIPVIICSGNKWVFKLGKLYTFWMLIHYYESNTNRGSYWYWKLSNDAEAYFSSHLHHQRSQSRNLLKWTSAEIHGYFWWFSSAIKIRGIGIGLIGTWAWEQVWRVQNVTFVRAFRIRFDGQSVEQLRCVASASRFFGEKTPLDGASVFIDARSDKLSPSWRRSYLDY